MKKIFILLPFVVGSVLYILLTSNSTGPGITSGMERTGATGMAGCGGACHSSPVGGSITDTITLLSAGVPVTKYTPGHSYTVHISAENTSVSTIILPRFGFQLTAVKTGTYVNAGTFVAPAGTHTCTPVAGVVVVEHTHALTPSSGGGNPGTKYTIDIPWTAPAAGTGTVMFRDAVNSVNYDSTNGGDVYDSARLSITENTSTGTENVNATEGHLSIYPNPASRQFTLNVESPLSEKVHVMITNILGIWVRELELNTNEPATISMDEPAGSYLISASTATQAYVQQVILR